MKLNLLKCAFGISAGKFLSFLVTRRGIKVNSDQRKVVFKTPIPFTKKEMQQLMGHLAALGQFVAHFTNKLHSFFTTLCRAQTFGWTEECKNSFDAIKHYLIETPILSSLEMGGELYMYLVVLDYAVSVILF